MITVASARIITVAEAYDFSLICILFQPSQSCRICPIRLNLIYSINTTIPSYSKPSVDVISQRLPLCSSSYITSCYSYYGGSSTSTSFFIIYSDYNLVERQSSNLRTHRSRAGPYGCICWTILIRSASYTIRHITMTTAHVRLQDEGKGRGEGARLPTKGRIR